MNPQLDTRLLEVQADSLTNQNSYSHASVKLQRILKHNPPKRAHIYCWLGNMHSEKKEHTKTHQNYKKAFIFNDPSFPDLRFKWAYILYKEKNFQESHSELDLFLQTRPSHLDALRLMGDVCFRLRLFAEADQAYSQVVRINPRYQNIYEDWASVRYFLEDFDGTKKFLFKAVATDRNASEARRRLGYIFLAEQEYQEATYWFERANDIDNAYSLTWFNWSLALMLQDKEEEAMVKFNKGLEFLENGAEVNQRAEVLGTLKNDLEFKNRYIASGRDEKIKAGFKASLAGLKKIISFIEQGCVYSISQAHQMEMIDI